MREKNFVSGQTSPLRSRSPIKTTYSSPSKSQLISSPNKARTPTRTGTFKVNRNEESPSKSTKFSRVYETKDGLGRSEENFNRDCVEKKTTIIDGEPEKGNYTKTTITEREETIEKKEIVQFTEKGPLRKSPSKLLEEFRAKRDKEVNETEKVFIDLSSNKVDDSRSLGSPSRFGSCRDSVVEEVFSSPIRKSRLNLATNSPSKKKDTITDVADSVSKSDKKETTEEEEDDDGSFKSGQRKRLKALASKFSNYDDEDSEAIKQVISQAAATGSPYKRDLTKTVDVDKIINRSAPATHNLDQDPEFMKSLKAQGFEESNSKSKLVYDFKKKNSSNTPNGSRDASPYKNDPMQYIRPQPKTIVTTATPPKPKSPTKKAPAYRSVSPTRMASPRTEASASVKPHPLQFISPQKANVVTPAPSNGPPKPPRTYIDIEEESPTDVFKTEVSVQVVKKTDEERTDTASRRSIMEKRNLWETPSDPQSDLPDPAMLPLSQRKALFEKNKSVPKPIARFGESVTPAMLSKASSNIVPASEPAWKRQKRDRSPEKQSFYTPGHELRPKPSHDNDSTPAVRREVGMKKNLFENNWKSNDIAKAQEEAKRKDMEVLMNRFQKVSEDVDRERSRSRSPERRVSPTRHVETFTATVRAPILPGSPSPKRGSPQRKSVSRVTPSPPKSSPPKKSPFKSPAEKYYPGVNSLKKIKVSPPRSGQLYPDLTEINDERPGTSMSEESSAPSEAPSLGTAIKRVASANK